MTSVEVFVHVFIHHGGSFVDKEMSKYERTISKMKCDVDNKKSF